MRPGYTWWPSTGCSIGRAPPCAVVLWAVAAHAGDTNVQQAPHRVSHQASFAARCILNVISGDLKRSRLIWMMAVDCTATRSCRLFCSVLDGRYPLGSCVGLIVEYQASKCDPQHPLQTDIASIVEAGERRHAWQCRRDDSETSQHSSPIVDLHSIHNTLSLASSHILDYIVS